MKQRRNRSESNYKRAKINSWCRLLEKDFDWDYTFLLEIERKKIIEMYEYFKKCTRSDKMPIVARDLQLCIGLLDIVLEKDNLQLEFSGMKTMRRDDGMYEMVESPHIKLVGIYTLTLKMHQGSAYLISRQMIMILKLFIKRN
ncbi:hypothetical protein [Bacteroides uniformis]|uniref:hypothetical protein n=1 Tax=Bacteroides uniformis TaxID=820 RepID=UPI002164B457|nr:hypothetical protein [Bacteroides uniformis]UVS16364.1 hypothetical protein NXX72_13715 [Bacteroides uniformis]